MKLRNKIIITAICLLSALATQAQEYPIYNQYHFHYYLLNPALAGAEECTHFMLTHKQQWLGIKDAPQTQILSFQTRTPGRLGIGAYLFNDKNGYSYQQGAQLTLAYHIPMSSGSRFSRATNLDRQLSFGVSGKIYRYDFSQDMIDEANAAGQPIDKKDGYYPNINFGVFFQSYQFFTGLTLTNMLPVKMDMFSDSEPVRPFSAFFQMGYAFEANRTLELEPSAVFKVDQDSRMQLDLSFRAIQHVEDRDISWWAGIIYKQNLDDGNYQPLTLLPNLTVRVGKFRFGYACGIDMNRLFSYNYGSHELMLGYSFCNARRFCR